MTPALRFCHADMACSATPFKASLCLPPVKISRGAVLHFHSNILERISRNRPSTMCSSPIAFVRGDNFSKVAAGYAH